MTFSYLFSAYDIDTTKRSYLKNFVLFFLIFSFGIICVYAVFLFFENQQLKIEILSLHKEIQVLKASAVGGKSANSTLDFAVFVAFLLTAIKIIIPANFLTELISCITDSTDL
jgi:hypothetical protein